MSFISSLYFRIFQPLLAFGEEASKETARALRAARIGFFPEWYLSLSYFSALVAGGVAAFLTAGVVIAASDLGFLRGLLFVVAMGVAVALVVRLGFLLYPRMRAASRAKLIDAQFPGVVTLCYALARGGVPVVDIFRAVAEEEKTYGEISKEFYLLVREIDWFGQDINTAVLVAAETTPSDTLKRFLEGLVTILNSGASPQDYFKRQAENQITEIEMTLEKELQQAALLAEVYVSGLLVLPLLLIVILSVLSGIGGGGDTFIPLIVFGLIPLGTAGYLFLLDILSPSETLQVKVDRDEPLVDFGIEHLPASSMNLAPSGKALWRDFTASRENLQLRLAVVLQAINQRVRKIAQQAVRVGLEKPVEVAAYSGTAGLLLLIGGGAYLLFHTEDGYQIILSLTSLLMLVIILVVVPVALFHEWRVRRIRRVDSALPEMLRKLSGFNDRGIGLMSAFQILGKESSGPLTPALASMDRDATWTSNFRGALSRMCQRINTLRIARLGVLFERASAATSNLKDVIDIAANDTSATEKILARRHQAMMTYTVIIYAIFFVFLYVVYMVATLFFGDGGLAASAAATQSPGGASVAGAGGAALAVDTMRLTFFHAVLIQGICCGFVAGRLGEGYLLSGLKHAVILSAIAWFTFYVGVI